jgi:hypothetical protein
LIVWFDQRGPPTDKESLQSKDISIKSDEEATEESPKIPASSQQKMTTEQEPSSSPVHASKQSQQSPIFVFCNQYYAVFTIFAFKLLSFKHNNHLFRSYALYFLM